MDKSGQKLLQLMFRPGETVCVSPNMYGYHSIPLEEALSDKQITLVPTEDSVAKRNEIRKNRNLTPLSWEEYYEYPHTDDLTLVALNPIKGFRSDENTTSYRNFLIEMDYGPLDQQLAYAKTRGVPYSAVVFSGNKSLHFLISLDTDVPGYKSYYFLAEWALNIVTAADQNTKNPSRSIRIPGAYREPDKQQQMYEWKGVTSLEDFMQWLNEYPEAKPKLAEKREVSDEPDLKKIREWVTRRLARSIVGAKQGRNKEWFAIGCEFALAGYDLDKAVDILSEWFTPERDFKEKEWKTSIKQGFKYIYGRKL